MLLFRGKGLLFQGVNGYLCILLYTGSKRLVVENQGLSGKNVYFCILLYTVNVLRGPVSFEFKGLNATDA